ncbi:MAG: hypothetical protein M0Q38_05385 [Bacteroidales bacterium]|nr:hypothetical protein [Bacteroidales bacterium]
MKVAPLPMQDAGRSAPDAGCRIQDESSLRSLIQDARCWMSGKILRNLK